MAYFFFNGSIAAQGNRTTLLLALIHQLLKVNPALAPLTKKYLAMNNKQFEMSLYILCEIFQAIVTSPERKLSGVVCVVDALDECETASMTKAIRFLTSMIFDSCNSTNEDRWLKLIVTSRHSQPIDNLFHTLPSHHRIKLVDYAAHTSHNIAKFIRAHCRHVQAITRCSNAMRHAVEKQLVKRSQNTFL